MDWLFLTHLLELPNALLAQAPPPLPSSASPTSIPQLAQEIELLKNKVELLQQTNKALSDSLSSQINFLAKENDALNKSFASFVDAMKWAFTILGLFGTFLTIAVAWVFKNNLDDARRIAREMIETRVSQQVGALVDAKVDDVKRTLQREQVVSSTLVDYYLPNEGHPDEFFLLEARKFRQVRLVHELEQIRRDPGDVIVLDLQNWILASGQRFIELPEAEREAEAEEKIAELLRVLPLSAVVVVYVRITIKYLFRVTNRYVLPANNPVTLVGNTADGAYVAVGDRRARNS
jgi:hypothetical protein